MGVVVFKRVERNHAIWTASVFCQCSRGQFELVKQKKERALVYVNVMITAPKLSKKRTIGDDVLDWNLYKNNGQFF